MSLVESFERAAARAAVQYGLVSLTQLLDCGFTRDQVVALGAAKRLMRADRGVYRLAGTPDHRNLSLMTLALRTGGVASHRSAAALLGLIDWLPRPEVTVARLAHYRGPGRIHRHQDLEPGDIEMVQGIPCTNAVRVLIDIGAVRTDLVAPFFHSVLDRRLATYDDIAARFRQVAKRGRNGVGPLRAVLEEYDPSMAPAQSPLEVLLLELIRDHGIKAPVRQHPVVIDGSKYFIDVAYPDEMIAIEGDGFGIHSEADRFESDRYRQNALVLEEWRVLRFTWRQIRHRPEYVAATIRAALQR